MRELKFKVWDNLNNKMHRLQGMTFHARTFTPADVKIPGLTWRTIEDFQLLQWIYLRDRNEIDVYEGDYIKISDIIYNVIWSEALVSFQLEALDSSSSRSIIDVSQGDIIGNRFENEVSAL